MINQTKKEYVQKEYVVAADSITMPGTDFVVYYKGQHITREQVETLAHMGVDVVSPDVILPMLPWYQAHNAKDIVTDRISYLGKLHLQYACRPGRFQFPD